MKNLKRVPPDRVFRPPASVIQLSLGGRWEEAVRLSLCAELEGGSQQTWPDGWNDRELDQFAIEVVWGRPGDGLSFMGLRPYRTDSMALRVTAFVRRLSTSNSGLGIAARIATEEFGLPLRFAEPATLSIGVFNRWQTEQVTAVWAAGSGQRDLRGIAMRAGWRSRDPHDRPVMLEAGYGEGGRQWLGVEISGLKAGRHYLRWDRLEEMALRLLGPPLPASLPYP